MSTAVLPCIYGLQDLDWCLLLTDFHFMRRAMFEYVMIIVFEEQEVFISYTEIIDTTIHNFKVTRLAR